MAQCIRRNFKVILNTHCFLFIVFPLDVGGGVGSGGSDSGGGGSGAGGSGGGGGTHWVEMILNRGKQYSHAPLTHSLAPRCSLYFHAPLRSAALIRSNAHSSQSPWERGFCF